MEITPNLERNRNTVDAATRNFDTLGLDVERPERVVYGFTPKGRAAYNPVADAVFMGPELATESDEYELITFEHENVHYEQFRRILGETTEDYTDLVKEAEGKALSSALESFDDIEFVNALTYDEHLNFYNLKTMMGLVADNEKFLEELKEIKSSSEDRLEAFDQDASLGDESVGEITYALAAQRAEEEAEKYWDDIRESSKVRDFRPLIERHDTDIRDDLLEAQAQFWELFRLGAFENLPQQKGEYPEPLENQLDNLKSYRENRFYNYGGNVENATRQVIENFRERKHTEGKSDHEIAVEIVNEGLERWDSDSIIKSRP